MKFTNPILALLIAATASVGAQPLLPYCSDLAEIEAFLDAQSIAFFDDLSNYSCTCDEQEIFCVTDYEFFDEFDNITATGQITERASFENGVLDSTGYCVFEDGSPEEDFCVTTDFCDGEICGCGATFGNESCGCSLCSNSTIPYHDWRCGEEPPFTEECDALDPGSFFNLYDFSTQPPDFVEECLSADVVSNSITQGSLNDAILHNVSYPACNYNVYRGIWYHHAGDGGLLTVEACSTEFPVQVTAFTGNCSEAACLGVGDITDDCAFYAFPTTKDEDYLFLVHSRNESMTGDYYIDFDSLKFVN